jgi:hypothetical protein
MRLVLLVLLACGGSEPSASTPAAPSAAAPAAKPAEASAKQADGPLRGGTLTLADGVEAAGKTVFVSIRPAGAAGGPPMAAVKLPPTLPGTFQVTMADVLPMFRRGPLPEAFDLTVRLDTDGDAITKVDGEPHALLTGVKRGDAAVKVVLAP